MIQTNYNAIPNKMFGNYLKYLINKVWKILPMYEENNSTLIPYLKKLQMELTGNLELIKELQYDGNLQTILNNIECIIAYDINHTECKKMVLDSIALIKLLQKRYGFED